VRLITAHRILIGAAILFFVFYAATTLVHGRPGASVHAIVSIVIAVGLIVYYRSLRKRWRPPS
jgi:hypothetical protein